MSKGPYIMPDGRTLGQYLAERLGADDQSPRKKRGKKGKKSSNKRDDFSYSGKTLSARVANGAEQDLPDVGKAKLRRIVQDRILLDMAHLTHMSDINSLFQPVPFGSDAHLRTPLYAIQQPQFAQALDCIREIEPNRQERFLQRWEARNRESRGEPSQSAGTPPVVPTCMACWKRVRPELRNALKKAPAATIRRLEDPLLMACVEATPGEVPLNDGYARLLSHGIAQYYDFAPYTIDCPTRGKVLRLRWPKVGAGDPELSCAEYVGLLQDHVGESVTVGLVRSYLEEVEALRQGHMSEQSG